MTLELEPIDPPTLMVVLSMTAPRWAHKARVVAVIGSFHGGAWISARDLARVVGRDERRCNTLLNELVDERVVLRRCQAGARPGWCEVNPDVGRWRRVPWVHDAHFVEALAALHEKRAVSTAFERLIARPIGAGQADLIARLIGAGLAPGAARDKGAASRGNGTRDAAELVDAHRAAMGQRVSNGASRAQERAFANGSSPTAVPTGNGNYSSVVGGDGPSAEPTTERIEVDEEALTTMRREVMRRAIGKNGGRKFVNGRPLLELTALVVRYPLPELLEALERAPVGELVPGLVSWLTDNVGVAEIAELPGTGNMPNSGNNTGPNPRWLEARIVALRREAAQCDAEGAPEAGDTYRAELAECETELAGVLAQLTGEDQ